MTDTKVKSYCRSCGKTTNHNILAEKKKVIEEIMILITTKLIRLSNV